MSWLDATRRRLSILSRQYRLSSRERAFMRADSKLPPPKHCATLAVECVEDHYYLALFSWIASDLRSRAPLCVEGVMTRSLRPGSSRSPLGLLKSVLFQNWLTDWKWRRLYRAYSDRIAYRSTQLEFTLEGARDWVAAWRLWKTATTPEAVLGLQVDGVPIGDLVYDSYLRFKPAPTLRAGDAYLLVVIRQALRDARRARKFFSVRKPAIFLTSYGTYIQHGIAVRVALLHEVRVFAFGNYQQFAKELSLRDWTHPRNPDGYKSGFAKLADPASAFAAADAKLAARVGGKLDVATAYMRQSAYLESGEDVPDVRGAAVIFLHDFFDSPHCYRWMLFPDFWLWVNTTLRLTRQGPTKIFVKPHPNQIAASQGIVAELQRSYPDVQFLSPRITNKQLAQAGISCAITVYGTVAHEMAYLGVPTLGSGDHPHISFDFCRTMRTLDEYAAALRDCADLPVDKEMLRRQSIEFYYMHNLDLSQAQMELRDRMAGFRALIARQGDMLPAADEYAGIRKEIVSQTAFVEFTQSLADSLQGYSVSAQAIAV